MNEKQLHTVPDEDLLEEIEMRMEHIVTIEEAILADETIIPEARPILVEIVAKMRAGTCTDEDKILTAEALRAVADLALSEAEQ
jgi:predicted nucleic-acid-binding protein